MRTPLLWAAIGVLVVSACQAPAPPVNAASPQGIPCLAPMQAGETDPAIRDVTVFFDAKKATFQACFVSNRLSSLALARVDVAILSPTVNAPVVWVGDDRPMLAPTVGTSASSPRLVVLLAREVKLPLSFKDQVLAATTVQITYQPCKTGLDVCVPDRQVSQFVVPARVVPLTQ